MEIIIVALLLLVILPSSSARELRPSEHGLIYQTETPSPAENAPSQSELKKFFGGEMNTTTSSPELPLPKAMNSSDPAWMNPTERRRKVGKGGDREKQVLLVASLVCGITGGVFLLAAGFIFLFRYKGKKTQVDKPVVEQQLEPSPSQPVTTDKIISDILSNRSVHSDVNLT